MEKHMDIVGRLRDAKMGNAADVACELFDLCAEAADEIERLQAMQQGYRDQSAHYMIENERLRAAMESLTQDPPATLSREPDTDAEVIIKMRAIAREVLSSHS